MNKAIPANPERGHKMQKTSNTNVLTFCIMQKP